MGYKQMLNDQVVGNMPQNKNNNYEDMDNKPSINGIELVGNLTTEDLGIEVPEITVDSELSETSENPVQNKIIKEAIENATPSIATSDEVGLVKPDGTTITIDENGTLHGNASVEVDTELSDTSENPVQNKAILARINEVESKILSDEIVINTKNFYSDTSATIRIESPYTKSGITFTSNSDGSISVSGQYDTSSGVAGAIYFEIPTLKKGNYKLTGFPSSASGGVNRCLQIMIRNTSTGKITKYIDSGSGVSFSIGDNDVVGYFGMSESKNTTTNYVVTPLIEKENSPDWELIGSATGTTRITIDSEKYKEFLIELMLDTSNRISCNFIVASKQLTEQNKSYRSGYYISTSNNASANIWITKTYCVINSAHLNGASKNDVATITVYGRK